MGFPLFVNLIRVGKWNRIAYNTFAKSTYIYFSFYEVKELKIVRIQPRKEDILKIKIK